MPARAAARLARLALAALALGAAPACQERLPAGARIADRSWRAHELVVAAGERARTCAEAGAAMERVFAAHREAFVDGLALDRDRARLEEATAFIAAHERRYRDLETRMIALSDRCADDPSVTAVFERMERP